MVSVLGNVLIHLGFERCQQHPPGALSHQRIQIQLECGPLVGFRSDYAHHAAYLFVDGLTIVRLQQPEGYAALLNSDLIHNFRLYLSYAAAAMMQLDANQIASNCITVIASQI